MTFFPSATPAMEKFFLGAIICASTVGIPDEETKISRRCCEIWGVSVAWRKICAEVADEVLQGSDSMGMVARLLPER